MYKYIIRRILSTIPVLFGVSVFVFIVMHVIPGDITSILLGTEATDELKEQLSREFDLHLPLYQQYCNWLTVVLVGDFGESFRTGSPILPEILTRFKLTFQLTIMASIIAWVIAIPLGIIEGLFRNLKKDFSIIFLYFIGVYNLFFFFSSYIIIYLFY